MRINFNLYNNSHASFKQNQSYNLGFNHGKNDGLIGARSIQKHDKEIKIDKNEYENGYNKGYIQGKSQRMTETATVTDVIQDLVNSGTPREQAIQFVASAFGGW